MECNLVIWKSSFRGQFELEPQSHWSPWGFNFYFPTSISVNSSLAGAVSMLATKIFQIKAFKKCDFQHFFSQYTLIKFIVCHWHCKCRHRYGWKKFRASAFAPPRYKMFTLKFKFQFYILLKVVLAFHLLFIFQVLTWTYIVEVTSIKAGDSLCLFFLSPLVVKSYNFSVFIKTLPHTACVKYVPCSPHSLLWVEIMIKLGNAQPLHLHFREQNSVHRFQNTLQLAKPRSTQNLR